MAFKKDSDSPRFRTGSGSQVPNGRRKSSQLWSTAVWLLILAGVLFQLLIGGAFTQSSGQGPPTGEYGPFGAKKLPKEAVPDYFAWNEFFDTVIQHKQFSEYSFSHFTYERIGLKKEEAYTLLDFAYRCKAINARYPLHRGELTQQLTSRVMHVKKLCFDLEDALGPAFSLVEEFVVEVFKGEFGYFTSGGPRDIEIRSIARRFEHLTRSEVERLLAQEN